MGWRTASAWSGLVVGLWFVGGWLGVLVALAVALYRVIGVTTRQLLGIGVILLAGVPLAMIWKGLADPATLDPRIVLEWSMANSLAFAGLACIVIGVIQSVDTGPLFGREREVGVSTAEGHEFRIADPTEGTDASALDSPAETIALVGTRADADADLASSASSGGRGHLVRGGAWTTVNVALQAITGAAFWLIAGRIYSVQSFGLASALFSSLLFVNFLTGMGLSVTLPLFASGTTKEHNTILTAALLYTTATSLIGTLLYLALVPSEAIVVLRERAGLVGWIVFFVSVAGASIGSLADVRLMIARRWLLVLARNNAVGFFRIVVLFVPPRGDPALWLFAVGSLPVAVTGLLALAALPRTIGVRYEFAPIGFARLKEAWRFASASFMGTLLSQAPMFVLPVIVLSYVSAVDYAQFFLAWSAASMVFLFPLSVAGVLLVESSRHREHEARLRYLETLAMSFGIMLLAAIATLLGRGLAKRVFPAFEPAVDLLPILVFGSLPWAYTSVAMARARSRKDTSTLLWSTGTLCALVITAALVFVPRDGSRGAIIAWSLGQAAAAVVALVVGRRRAAASAGGGREDRTVPSPANPATIGAADETTSDVQ